MASEDNTTDLHILHRILRRGSFDVEGVEILGSDDSMSLSTVPSPSM